MNDIKPGKVSNNTPATSQPAIYFSKKSINDLDGFVRGEEPAHEKIGAVFTAVLSAVRNGKMEEKEKEKENSGQIPTLLHYLGVNPKDEGAVKEMTDLLINLEDENLRIVPTDNTGIYFIQIKEDSSDKQETEESTLSAEFSAEEASDNSKTDEAWGSSDESTEVESHVETFDWESAVHENDEVEPNLTENPTDTNSSEKVNKRYKNIGVIKIGRKRAKIETAVRSTAHQLGLAKHMIPGMFCGVLNPHLSSTEETVEELWSGKEKVYQNEGGFCFSDSDDSLSSSPPQYNKGHLPKCEKDEDVDDDFFSDFNSGTPQKLVSKAAYGQKGKSWEDDSSSEEDIETTACAVVGIVQPFLHETQEASTFEFTCMTMLALAIGLRDGKNDGYKGSTLFDVDDCFPVRIDPIFTPAAIKKSASAIDLPYLDKDPRTETHLSLEEVGTLASMVQQWRISQIVMELGRLKIQYEDKYAERMCESAEGLDEGNCHVRVVKADPPHQINGRLNHMSKENAKRRVLLPEQLDAFNTRLQRMHDFIMACAMQQKTFTPRELVHAVDKWGKIYMGTIRRSPVLRRDVEKLLNDRGEFWLSGRHSPKELELEFGDELSRAIEEMIYGTSSPSTTPSPSSELVATLEEMTQQGEEQTTNNDELANLPPLEED